MKAQSEAKLKPVPEFKSEADERAFWESPENDSTVYVQWSKAKMASFPKLPGAPGLDSETGESAFSPE
jgi:CopG antitoxin of type II toxin-antitoxin system